MLSAYGDRSPGTCVSDSSAICTCQATRLLFSSNLTSPLSSQMLSSGSPPLSRKGCSTSMTCCTSTSGTFRRMSRLDGGAPCLIWSRRPEFPARARLLRTLLPRHRLIGPNCSIREWLQATCTASYLLCRYGIHRHALHSQSQLSWSYLKRVSQPSTPTARLGCSTRTPTTST